jgi:hypothetical protein
VCALLLAHTNQRYAFCYIPLPQMSIKLALSAFLDHYPDNARDCFFASQFCRLINLGHAVKSADFLPRQWSSPSCTLSSKARPRHAKPPSEACLSVAIHTWSSSDPFPRQRAKLALSVSTTSSTTRKMSYRRYSPVANTPFTETVLQPG